MKKKYINTQSQVISDKDVQVIQWGKTSAQVMLKQMDSSIQKKKKRKKKTQRSE